MWNMLLIKIFCNFFSSFWNHDMKRNMFSELIKKRENFRILENVKCWWCTVGWIFSYLENYFKLGAGVQRQIHKTVFLDINIRTSSSYLDCLTSSISIGENCRQINADTFFYAFMSLYWYGVPFHQY
jgi:hypothetical protein